MAAFQCFAADPWFDCFSIGRRVKDGLRPPLRGGLRPSLTRHPIEKDLACIGSAARVWRSGFRLGAGLGPWAGRARTARCPVGAYDSGRHLVNRSQGSRRFGRVGIGAGSVISSPLTRRVPHGRGGSPSSGAWGTFTAVGECPRQGENGQCGVEGSAGTLRGAPGRTASASAQNDRRLESSGLAGPGGVDSSPGRLGAAGETDCAVG